MRRSFRTAYSLTFLVLAAGGCRQTTGVNTAGPLTPIGPMAPGASAQGSLTPLGAGQSPALGPFGGNTRVTPPPTGSYVAPNNYLGGAGNPASASYNAPPASAYGSVQGAYAQGNYGSVAGNAAAIGSGLQANSGVQVTGWNDANAASGVATAAENPFRSNPSNPVTPRSGGMRVNDLTGGQPELQPAPVAPTQQYVPQQQQQLAPQQQSPQWQSTQTIVAPQPAEIATRPSTEPTSNLQWRRPASR